MVPTALITTEELLTQLVRQHIGRPLGSLGEPLGSLGERARPGAPGSNLARTVGFSADLSLRSIPEQV